MKTTGRVALSVFALFQIFIIFLTPNGTSYPGRALSWLVQPYGAILGLNTPWNFFSPDPAHTMFLRLNLFWEKKDQQEDADSQEIYFPEARDLRQMDLSKRRQLYALRYLMLDPRRVEALLGPWYCRQNPGLESLTIEHIIQPIPDIEKAAKLTENWRQDIQATSYGKTEYRCSQMENEVSL